MKLNVFRECDLVGVLEKDGDDVYSFQYASDWLTHPNGFDLSIQLPRQTIPFGNRQTQAFFENLLPEGPVRQILAQHRVQGVIQTLTRYGQDCAGAIVVTPESVPPTPTHDQQEVLFSRGDIEQAIGQGTIVDALVERNPGYLSIAGAQDKFPAIVRGDQVFLPLSGQPTTHIIKPPIARFKESVYNEYFCMQLADAVGLPVPHVQVLQGTISLFVIERFDRQYIDGRVRRLHQQDFCQALGLSSTQKYESQGGPSFAACVQLIKQHVHVTHRAKDLFTLLDWLCFNLLIGNNDSHAKNISLLSDKGRYRLTPFYDLLCTVIYPSLQRDFAFQLGGRFDVLSLSVRNMEKMEQEVGIKSGTLLIRLQQMWDRMTAQLPIVVATVEQELPDCKIAARIARKVQKRTKGFRTIGLHV
jgi:serine/threonine-protein kinase HipA